MNNSFFLRGRGRTLLAGLLSLLGAGAQAQLSPFFEWQNPRPLGAGIVDVHGFNDSTAYAAGLDNIGYRTTDDGRSWQRYPMGITNGVEEIPSRLCFVGDTMGWVVQGKVYRSGGNFFGQSQLSRTTNGGRTWQVLPGLSLSRFAHLVDVHFVTRRVGYVLYDYDGNTVYVRRSLNGGVTWQPPVDLRLVPGYGGYAQQIQFVNANTGWVMMGEGFAGTTVGSVFGTTDGGLTWQNRTPPDTLAVNYYAGAFADTQRGWVFGTDAQRQPHNYRTTNGGLTWQPMSLPVSVTAAAASDAQHVVVMSPYGESWFTADGGLTWQPAPTGRWNQASLRPSGVGWSSDPYFGVNRTTDFGATWTRPAALPLNTAFLYGEVQNLTFLDADRGWAGLRGNSRFFRTTSRGATWQVLDSEPGFAAQQVSGATTAATFPDIDTAFAAVWYQAGNGAPIHHGIIRTGDGGQNWQLYRPPLRLPRLQSIANSTSRHVCAVGDSGAVLLSHDGGQTWQRPARVPTTQRLWAVAWASPWRLCAVGDSAKILLSTDGGLTWTSQPNPNTGFEAPYVEVQWRTPTEAWLSTGSPNRFMRSTDGGVTWSLYVAPEAPGAPPAFSNYYPGYKLQVLDSARLVYADQRPVFSGDSGQTWEAISDSYVLPYGARYFVDRYNGWFTGGGASLLHYSEKFVRADTALTQTTYCAGDSLALGFALTGTFGPAEQAFVAELSDATGRWRHPIRVGQGAASPLLVRLPAALASGSRYRLRVSRVDRSVIGGDNTHDLTITARPAAPVLTVTQAGTGSALLTAAPVIPGATYVWTGPNGPVAGATGPTLLLTGAAQNGPYTVSVTASGCISPPSNAVSIVVTGLADAISQAALTLSPNPAATAITLRSGLGLLEVTVLDQVGRAVLRIPGGGAAETTVSVATLAEGSYQVRATLTTGQQLTRRLLVRH